MAMRSVWSICAHFGRASVRKWICCGYCDENNGTWTGWEDVLVCHFWKSPGGDPPSRGGARVVSPYPLSISQSHIQIYILTLHLLP